MMDIETLNKAIALTQNGYIKEAENLYLSLLEQDSEDAILLSALGLFYVNVRDFDKAIIHLKKACEINKTIGTISALGFCEFERGKYKEASQILEEALTFGESANVYDKLILSCFHIKDYKKAIEYSIRMFAKYPDDINSVTNMIKSLTQSGKLMDAEKLCVEYLKKDNNIPSLWFHLGFLKELIYSDDKQACQCYKIALELGHNEAHYNIAVSYQKQREFEKAEEHYKKMLEYFPNDIDTITSLGMCYLTQKIFKKGYDLFFQREKNELDKKINNPWKLGSNFSDEIVVLCDQGFGDHIQFIRYIPFLKEKVKNIFVATHKSLKPLFEKNYPEVRFITYEEINPNMQSIKITDLAYALNIDFENIPFSSGYLTSETKEIESNKLKVGICWEAGSAGIRTMINRTINVKLFEPFFDLKNIQFYSFQVTDTFKGNEKYPQMINLAKDFKDFEDTAKAMKSMDLIISVDTAVAHLAGALGIRTFLMLPYVSDWRWFGDTQTTPWYNSIEIFKQTDPISWEKPIEDIICKLKEYSS